MELKSIGSGSAGRILAVAGGKGGVGKSVVSIVLAAAFSERGDNVVLVDLDLGSANLHTYLGIHDDMPGVADFLLKKVRSLSDLLVDTSIERVKLISGARFFPGMANPPYQTKLKLIRHLKGLCADVVIVDLGAGVHFNTLDFFAVGRPGLITLAPEPGAVLNAYSFIKAGLFRHLMSIFGRHPQVRSFLDEVRTKGDDENGKSSFTLESFLDNIKRVDISLVPLVEEVIGVLQPAMVMNQVTDLVSAVYADNLQKLILKRLALKVHYLGNLPWIERLSQHIVGLPGFFSSNKPGKKLLAAAGELLVDLDKYFPAERVGMHTVTTSMEHCRREDFDEDDLNTLSDLLDEMKDDVFKDLSKTAWKLRLYYRPAEVVRFLMKHGVSHPVFFLDSTSQ